MKRARQNCLLAIIYLTVVVSLSMALPFRDDQLDGTAQEDGMLLANSSTTLRLRRDFESTGSTHHRHRSLCQPDPRSHHLERRSLCPFEIHRDTNPHRIPDVILRAHCHCESSPCSHPSTTANPVQPARCMSIVSPIKVAYLDPQLRFVVSTEVVHVPVACICATQPPGRHMPQQRNIVV